MNDKVIQGNPTKTFFIEMITRDISIKDAILDLLDNSIDGANEINKDSYVGLYIDIIVNANEFIIKDNCGGFSLETAQKYAFRFGRPDDAPSTEGSIGRFGVGMKRALFKIGQVFEVETKTNDNHFQIDVSVSEWKSKKKIIKNEQDESFEVEDWNFNYSDITPETSNLEANGTHIKVSQLNKEVLSFFSEESFLNELRTEIEKLLNFSLEKGIRITLNGVTLQKKGISLFNDQSKPYSFESSFDGVNVKIAAGLSYVGEPKTSGWYVYCNDRLVLEADQSELTFWGTNGIPKWHVNFVMFKGVIFFDSPETIKLPLTTTKKGIDATSEVYIKSKFYMIEAMNSVLSFLKEVSKLGSEANDYRKLLGEQEDKISVKELKSVVFENSRRFISPTLVFDTLSVKNELVRISFNANREMAEKGKLKSKTNSFKEFGEYIFNYYTNMEQLEENE